MDRDTILGKLPAFTGNYELIAPDQSIGDIIAEVLDAHAYFSTDYNKIALCFDQDNVKEVCDKLFSFCKKNFVYDEQDEDNQATMSPAAMLTFGKVDCKNYAGFCGGILDGLNRLTDRKINWCYRFASYKPFDSDPHHVFIVVNPGSNEIWIDPTPGSNKRQPIWQIDKKIKAMALHRVSGVGNSVAAIRQPQTVGIVVTPNVNIDNLNFDGTGKYKNAFGPHLALSAYADFENSSGTDFNSLADQINSNITSGPNPGHSVTPDFVKWVFDNVIRSWNFYYEGGVQPGYNADGILPATYPRPVFTDDHRLIFSPDVALDDYRNAEIHILTAWLQDIVNNNAEVPWPVKPREVKEFSQGRKGDNFLGQTRREHTSLFDWVKMITLSGPRNAFLGLVGLNVFGMATKLKHALFNYDGTPDDGYYKLQDKWESLGGKFDALVNTVNDGAKKNAILGNSNTIGVVPAVPAWLVTASAIIAAIMPLVKSLLTAKQQKTGIDYNINAATGLPYPEAPIHDTSNNPLSMLTQNPVLMIGLAGGILYFSTRKKKVTGLGNPLTIALIAGGALLLLNKKSSVAIEPAEIIDNPIDTPQINVR